MSNFGGDPVTQLINVNQMIKINYSLATRQIHWPCHLFLSLCVMLTSALDNDIWSSVRVKYDLLLYSNALTDRMISNT